ncbi:hypothetical protein [Dactylosporangium salmoneum]|uniref:Uncharacterized protein n=1 Tax=Dactylosporangium salmoneum TaxID=53361 RepID=A0ABP5T7G4_9ACTN
MNRRTCACGVDIVCADLDGHDVWLDSQPQPDGWFRHLGGGRIVVDLDGGWRRHTCGADPKPVDVDPEPRPTAQMVGFRSANNGRARRAARRSYTAAREVLDAGRPLAPVDRRVAELRVERPDADCRELAAVAGITTNACRSALQRVSVRANKITAGKAA